MKAQVREAALAKLKAYLANPLRRSIEENAPVLVLKNNKCLMIEETFPIGTYIVSRDFGMTCKELGRGDLNKVLDIIFEEGK